MLACLESLRELNTLSVLLRLGLAMLTGGMIGLERGRKRRPAGFRTYMLVCLGAALTMLLGQYQSMMLDLNWMGAAPATTAHTDISRFSAQVINGIGFLGAGTIILTGRQEVKGLTTAACLWASACMGLAIGAGFYECVLMGFFLIFFCVHFLTLVETFLMENSRDMSLYIEFRSLDHVRDIINCIKAHDVHIYEIDINRGKRSEMRNPSGIFTIRLKKKQRHSTILANISELEYVLVIDEI